MVGTLDACSDLPPPQILHMPDSTLPQRVFTFDTKGSSLTDSEYCGYRKARVAQATARNNQRAFLQQEAAEEMMDAGVCDFLVSWPREDWLCLSWRRRTPSRKNSAAAIPACWKRMPYRGRQGSRRSRSWHISGIGRTCEQPLRRSLESSPRPKVSVRSINGVGNTRAANTAPSGILS